MIIDGKKISEEILARLRNEPHPSVFLVALLVGRNPASASFVRQKEQTARTLGVEFHTHQMETSSNTGDVVGVLRAYVVDPACGGIVVQLPLPPQVSRATVLDGLPIEKDVDAIGSQATRALENGFARVLPPAVGTLRKIVDTLARAVPRNAGDDEHTELSWLAERRATVVGAEGFLVGKPIAAWLEGRVAHLAAIDLGDSRSSIAHADLVVTGTGEPRSLRPNELKPGATVIDFGYGLEDGKLRGDFDTRDEQALAHLAAYTPTPGGTGPILVAQLFENFYRLNR